MRAPIDEEEFEKENRTKEEDSGTPSSKEKLLYRMCCVGQQEQEKIQDQKKTKDDLAQEAARFLDEDPKSRR